MKKLYYVLCIVILIPFLAACNRKIEGNNGLISKAREELTARSDEKIDIKIAGRTNSVDSCLIWYVAEDSKQPLEYIALEFRTIGVNKYEFTHKYTTIERVPDISAVLWKNGYSFLVNNSMCKYISLTYAYDASEIIEVNKIPFVYYSEQIPIEYNFLDEDKNILQ